MAGRSAIYEQYIKSAKWRRISTAMKKFAGFTCQGCGAKLHPTELDVHHITYDRLGNERPSDLRVLCRAKCHPVADAKRTVATQIRREERQYQSATDTYLSKKYGDNYAAFADDGMYEEAETWLSRKRYGESGEEW